ncbi:uncharacterized protein LOC127859332 [Dreissena polymorpha]|uniref:uncharacterized protein LOC127859332 n=1 Tax=Dreissena polymorpha TaxID=45954 RepID=UPI002263CEEC|nr:uncharacterized protein LOC127859332 [Dreissena polymorpha]
MAFYLTPPSGNIALHKLTEYTVTRLQFLRRVMETNGHQLSLLDVVKEGAMCSDCLIEGSIKDKISHFMLRMTCAYDKSMTEFFITTEAILFDFRFSCMNFEELCRLFKSLDVHLLRVKRMKSDDFPLLAYSNEIVSNLNAFQNIKDQFGKWKHFVHKYLEGDNDFFCLPFQHVLHLVAKRHVDLHHGVASISIGKLRDVVAGLYRKMLVEYMTQASKFLHTDDTRIRRLIHSIKALYRMNCCFDNTPSFRKFLPAVSVDDVVVSMPPCMSHLHRTLRTQHRLCHQSRIQYSLFLKEAGMPVREALVFWRAEYSQPRASIGNGGHLWTGNEARYTYSIRHLYGLEGSRINYRGHSCHSLQNSPRCVSEQGGCPFATFDRDNLKKILDIEGIYETDEILEHAAKGRYSAACAHVFQWKTRKMDQKQCLHEKTYQREDGLTVLESELKSCNNACECSDKYENVLAAITSPTIAEDHRGETQGVMPAEQRTVKFDTPVQYFDEFQRLLNSMQDICSNKTVI